MNSVYESLRTLLRNKELEIKKLEKEIEALRIVLPIVAEASESGADSGPTFESPRPVTEINKGKSAMAGPDFENVMAQVKATSQSSAPAAAPSRSPSVTETVASKPRTSWP